MPGPLNSLVNVQVLDLSDDTAGAYCAKLLTDAGAVVVKIESPAGHPLRSWSRSGSVGSDGDGDGALFRYLAAGQRSVVVDPDDASDRARLERLASASDIILAGRQDPENIVRLHDKHPQAVIVAITPFGLDGPRGGEQVSDFLLQALSGSLYAHGTVDGSPLAVGGGVTGWIPGAYAAAGALAARARAEGTGQGEIVDVSTLECFALTLVSYPSVRASLPGGTKTRSVYRLIPGIEPCEDGLVGFTTLTVQQWQDFLAMIDRHDLIDSHEFDDILVRIQRSDEILPAIHSWTMQHKGDEIVDLAADFRVPATPVLNGATVTALDHLQARELFDVNPRGGFPHPRPPFRSSATERRMPAPAPALGEHQDLALPSRPTTGRASADADHRLPLDGVRVLDCTAFWAGPCATQYLAMLGADVIKVESIQRPDGMRFNVTVPPTVEQWYEQGALYLAANLNKRGITLNLADDHGRELFLALAARSDVVFENYSPRVMENFRLTFEDLKAVRADIVMVRMPGWGLEGPWRDHPGFATTMEQASGMAWVTGYEDGPPMVPGLCDPLAGIHAVFATLAALEERRASGRGQQVEVSMIDMAVNVAAEQIVEYAVYGNLMTREGNRDAKVAPQGAYSCADRQTWVALSVSNDAEWLGLKTALGNPRWADEPALATAEGRNSHSRLDDELAAWCGARPLDSALAALREAGVPAEPVVPSHAIDTDEQLQHRAFWQPVAHPVVGTHQYPGWPIRLSGGPTQWYTSAAPLLGQHTEEVLKELGLTDEQLADLREAKVIGDRPRGL
jgi:crotonobetainyl-CoA:carnitine CoA-transferase CaiB-like acyl-CoA transferase